MEKLRSGRPRNRVHYAVGLIIVILLGLASRRYGIGSVPRLPSHVGDTLWGLMVFLLGGLLFTKWSTGRLFLTAVSVAWLDELSQLYHAPWIDAIRHTTLGHLVLGDTFVWSDLVSYLAGASLGVVMDVALKAEIDSLEGEYSEMEA